MDPGLGTDLPTPVEPSHAKAGRAAAVGYAHFQVGTLFQNAAENQRSHQQGILQRHADAVGHCQAVGAFQHHIVLRLGMKEKHRAHSRRGLKQRQKLRLVPIPAVDHGIQFRAFQPQGIDRPFQFPNGGRYILHRQGSHSGKAVRRFPDKGGDVVIHLLGLGQAGRRLQVVAEYLGMQGYHLNLGAKLIHIGKALLRGKAQLGIDANAFAGFDGNAAPALPLVAHPVPIPAGIQGREH